MVVGGSEKIAIEEAEVARYAELAAAERDVHRVDDGVPMVEEVVPTFVAQPEGASLAEEFVVSEAPDAELDTCAAGPSDKLEAVRLAKAAILGDAPTVEAPELEPARTGVTLLTSLTGLRRALVEGALVTVTSVERRADRNAQWKPAASRQLGRTQPVTAVERSGVKLADGSRFSFGHDQDWSFENGSAIQQTALSRTVYRVALALAALSGTVRLATRRRRAAE
ncbi:hypothetical protein [Salinibacterium sp. ZJ450]|uniref:hypothetical protein n=1 Tax=Salinibacterium sp. ZJ450 TaxID=2708338 RepID=UPI00141FB3CC|nr:hypothetical protein [Salinibacterium sp. ZJ450]